MISLISQIPPARLLVGERFAIDLILMEPLSGLEPETFRLQGGCSTN